MNDATPRKFTGSLLERASALYDLAPPPVLPRHDPLPEPAAAQPAQPAPIAREPDPVVEFVAEPAPVAAPAAQPAPGFTGTRRRVAIDRATLRERGMLVPGASVTALAEEYRLVKRQLLLTARSVATGDAAKARALLICSARPNDGKTFTAINLALSLAAEKDVEIVLVDADFAKPDVMGRLGIDAAGPGLLDALGDDAVDVEGLIVDTDVPQLSLLPAGKRTNSDTELLASDRARRVLERLTSANPRRIVIFDSPPALAASPAGVLAGHVGQVLLVVRADKTGEGDLRDAVALLDACEHVQLLINSVAFQPGGRRFGSYYGQEPQA